MLKYLWSRFTASESAANNNAQIITNDYEATIAERDAQIESLKRSLTHKTDLADSYRGATERRDERIKELERQNNEYVIQYAMQSDSVKVLERQFAEARRQLAAIDAIFRVNLSPFSDKTDGDTAEYPAPVNAIADTTIHGE